MQRHTKRKNKVKASTQRENLLRMVKVVDFVLDLIDVILSFFDGF